MTRLRIAEWPGWMTTDGLTRATVDREMISISYRSEGVQEMT